jgi:2-polyprenyl-6-methoxyphenol hydroxylase and related FAD-dependent oxidoreductases
MAIQHPDIQPAVNHSVQVAIAGAGPVGLMMANYLGQMGIDVLVVEKLDKLIDYPRAIGIDDEALRTMQSVGLVDECSAAHYAVARDAFSHPKRPLFC